MMMVNEVTKAVIDSSQVKQPIVGGDVSDWHFPRLVSLVLHCPYPDGVRGLYGGGWHAHHEAHSENWVAQQIHRIFAWCDQR